ncbi:hypothetical protein E4631_07930 [Hymenobacter sp. UV11]|uniref:carboxypeptidase regulatory-like domain-containing protein n=1 Tax=Hymenobacter sp. UV11 TaxID=1849735 RepID=UPI001060663D|nr:carboxypeptidase regulatory-like domain-containing protein [Hymenobacter sp. UV11]TDN36184.1 hypothetical protein A8B98_09640 [Hymenobacter sp. UV11]TFZ66887.1 hypothetical protein E4631_07930 [Hymenobacter sp. UV11]
MKKTILALLLPLRLLAVDYPVVAQYTKPVSPVSTATRTLTGRVTDAQGHGLAGVTVLMKGTTTGTHTNAAGYYRLAGVPLQGALLQFSLAGFSMQDRAALVAASLNVVLQAHSRNEQKVKGDILIFD